MSRLVFLAAVWCVGVVWCGSGPVLAQADVSPAEGFTVGRRIAFPPGAVSGGAVYLADGSIASYDATSGQVRAHGAGGSTPLETFDPPVFGSFLVRSLDGSSLIFGENTDGGIYSISLAGAGRVQLDSIRYNFDLAFDAEGRGFVSAPGLNGGNSIRLLDGDPAFESKEIVTALAGFSGPVAVDRAGHLYYGTSAAGPQSLLRFDRDLVAAAIAGEPLVEGDAQILATDIGSFYDLSWAGHVLVHTDLGFATGAGGIFGFDVADDFRPYPIATFPPGAAGIVSPTFLDYRPGPRPFLAGAGPKGGALLVWASDFAEVNEIVEIVPVLHFVRGRVNSDAEVDISDAIALLGFLFSGDADPEDSEAADVNADQVIDLSDSVFLLDFLFRGGPVIPAPFPEAGPAP